jgi:5'-3' exonuclease
MGIQGLLKGLQPFSSKSKISDFSNQVLAVDASSWLHKSVYSISERHVEAMESSSTTLDPECLRVSTNYVQRRCQELLHGAKIRKIYLVFDGKRCPLKAQTNKDREDRRRDNLEEARRWKQQGRRDRAEEKYKLCIKISSQFSDAVAQRLKGAFARDSRIVCVASPYEADAQLVKLCVDGLADAIVTEDSDVLVYSAACQVTMPIILKLDRKSGSCDVISMDWLICGGNQQAQEGAKKTAGALESILISLADRQQKRPGSGVRLFVQACVLAGSDYSPNQLNGVGLVTAFKMLRDHAHRDCSDRFRKVLETLPAKNREQVNIIDYEENLAQSETVFYLHPVLDLNNRVTTLTAPRMSNQLFEGPAGYSPSIQRFGGDLNFLGEVNISERIDGAPLKQPQDDSPLTRVTHFPIAEIQVSKKRKRKDQSKTKHLPDFGASEAQRVIQTVRNPYIGKKQYPLQDRTNTFSSAPKSPNPFQKFARTSADGNTKSTSASVFLDRRIDIRFVKRKFTADGKPVPNPNLLKTDFKPRYCAAQPLELQQRPQANCQEVSFPEPDQADLTMGRDLRTSESLIDESSAFLGHTDSAIYIDDNEQFYDEGFASSKYFARSSGEEARRVTLESPPQEHMNYSESFSNYGGIGSYSRQKLFRSTRLSSPGDDSVISEVEDFQASLFSNQGKPAQNRSSSEPSSLKYGDSVDRPTSSLFQSYYASSLPASGRPNSRSGNQASLFDAWSNASTSSFSSGLGKTRVRPSRPLSRNSITNFFGYKSVVEEKHDDDFMDL